jgi:hypothetical protein
MDMARIDGIDPERLTDDDTASVLRAQAKAWGVPLVIAWENASSTFNRALRIPSQGLWKRA